jgi:hypothetical protein
VAVVLSVLACALSAAALWREAATPPVSAALPDSMTSQMRQLAAKIDALQGAVAQLEADRHEPAASAPRPTPERSVDPSPEFARRLDALEQEVAALEGQLKSSTSEQELAARKLAQAKLVDLRDAQRVATDRGASEKDKLAALRKLRGQKTDDGRDALTHDVILAMLDIAERSDTEDSRLDVYRNLHGASDPSVKESMLRALTQDSSAKVREKVADDIDTFLGDPLVQSALRDAADRDADLGVRAQAAKTLAGKGK